VLFGGVGVLEGVLNDVEEKLRYLLWRVSLESNEALQEAIRNAYINVINAKHILQGRVFLIKEKKISRRCIECL